jgi:hypothetical protein
VNKRIQELLLEAKEQSKEGKWHAPTAVWAEKFAELIVRECAQVSEDDIADGDACCTNTAYRIASQIKKHFGIE